MMILLISYFSSPPHKKSFAMFIFQQNKNTRPNRYKILNKNNPLEYQSKRWNPFQKVCEARMPSPSPQGWVHGGFLKGVPTLATALALKHPTNFYRRRNPIE
jgi:hypothetical protein